MSVIFSCCLESFIKFLFCLVTILYLESILYDINIATLLSLNYYLHGISVSILLSSTYLCLWT